MGRRVAPRPAGPVRRLGRLVSSLLLTLGAVLGVACAAGAVATPLLHLRPLIFLSGSMSPTVPAGSLGLGRLTAAEDLRVGDVVTVPVDDTFVTHRVVEVSHHGETATLRLKGDGNRNPDAVAYQVGAVPRLVAHAPYAGSLVAWFSRVPGVFVLAAYAVFLLSALRRRPADPAGPVPPPVRHGRRRRSRGASVRATLARTVRLARVLVLGGGPLLAPFVLTPPAYAAWLDSVAVSGTTLSTVTPSAPTVSCGVLSVGSTTLSWSAVANATGYRLFYGAGGATTEDVGSGTLSKTFTGTTGGTFSVKAMFGSTSWLSASSNAKSYTSVLGLLGTCL